MTRARLLLPIAILLAAAPFLSGAHREETRTVYFGTYTKNGSQGIYVAHLNEKTGALSQPQLAAETTDPSYLALHPTGPYMYAVNEGTAQVSAFRIDSATGKLTLLNQQPTGGKGPCHLALDSTGRMLAVANYEGGSVATYPVGADGRMGDRKSFIQFAGKGPHAHSINFTDDNERMLVNDLGGDATHVYKANSETADITEESTAAADAGAGPRHLAIAPNGKFVYVLNELRSTITRYSFDGAALHPVDSVSMLPPSFHGKNSGAEIELGPKGKYLYASNRGHDSIAIFGVESGGIIRLVQHAPTGGHIPRGFAIDPSGKWLLAANQESDNVVVFRLDQKPDGLSRPGLRSKWAHLCAYYSLGRRTSTRTDLPRSVRSGLNKPARKYTFERSVCCKTRSGSENQPDFIDFYRCFGPRVRAE